MVWRKASETKLSATALVWRRRRIFLTSQRTITGTKSKGARKYASNRSALVSAVKYSSHPEESTTTASESISSVTIGILPLHPFFDSAQILKGSRAVEVNR